MSGQEDIDEKGSKKVLHRRKHKNSRLGCPQCRQRRIKCDEALPSCQRCISRKVRCGYLDFTQEQKDAIIDTHLQGQSVLKGNYRLDQALPVRQVVRTLEELPLTDDQVFINQQQNYQGPYEQQQHPIQFVKQQQMYVPQTQMQPHQQHILQSLHNKSNINKYSTSLSPNANPSPKRPSMDSNQGLLPSDKLMSRPSPQSTHSSNDITTDPSSLSGTVLSSPTLTANSTKLLVESYIHPIEDLARKYPPSTDVSPAGSKRSVTSIPEYGINSKKVTTPPQFNKETKNYEVPLIPHHLNNPQYDTKKYPEFLNETISLLFARVFLFTEIHSTITRSFKDPDLLKGAMLQATATLLPRLPELNRCFLKYRVECINIVRRNIVKLNDSNSQTTLNIASFLYTTTCFFKGSTYKDFFALAAGPGILLKLVLENPQSFPETLPLLQSYADGFIFTTKYVWFPPYPPDILYELFEIYKEFGKSYVKNAKVNDNAKLVRQYDELYQFFESTFELLENESLPDNVVKFPIDKLVSFYKKGLSIVPSEMFVLSANNSSIELVFYSFWFVFTEMLKFILSDCNYIFTFALNGFYTMHPFDKNEILETLKDEKLIWYFNYSCRVLAFLVRRHAYLLRNTVLNDPFPNFMDRKDRLKTRALDIHEVFIKSFKNSIIKKTNYPSESLVSENLNNSSQNNYYKKNGLDNDENIANDLSDMLTTNFEHGINDDETDKVMIQVDGGIQGLDFVHNINPENSLLKQDYDPRFIDPIFNEIVNYQLASLDFVEKYIQDRRIIMQMKSTEKEEEDNDNE